MISSWLSFTDRTGNHSVRVHHDGNAEKYHPILQSPPYGDFASVDDNPFSFFHGPRSRAKVISKGLADRLSDVGLRGRRCISFAAASGFRLVTSIEAHRRDWFSFCNSSADLAANGSQEISQMASNTSELYNPRRGASDLVFVNSYPAGRGTFI
jgi:hypothetical protein